jgi:thiosulfate/3-mercaptopyruvate sulfurtransferase
MFTTLPGLLVALCAAADRPAAYTRPELLIEPADLARPEVAARYAIFDARGKGPYLQGHVPGAVWLDAVTWARKFGEGEDREGWEKRVGALGITLDTPVAVYDDSMSKDAARVWWILRFWGVKDVRLVNGGWKGYVAAGGPVQKGEFLRRPVEVRLKPANERLTTKGQLLDIVKGTGPQVIDARSAGEFCGTEKHADRGGAVPGARHLEWSDTLDKKTGRFKPAPELAELFRAAGIDPAKPAITYCQSGGRASVMAFALELMGGKDVRNYYRSWSEWGNDPATPVVTPKPKEK